MTFDADGQHSDGDPAAIVSSCGRAGVQVTLGSRFLGDMKGATGHRKGLLKMAVHFTRATTGYEGHRRPQRVAGPAPGRG